MEFVKTNVLGAENLIQACIDTGVERELHLVLTRLQLLLIYMVLQSFVATNYLLLQTTSRVIVIYVSP